MYDLNDLLNDKNMNNYINALMFKAYNRYSLLKYIEYSDYTQEIYLYLIQVLPKYDERLSSINSYLFSCIYNKSHNIFRGFNTIGRKDGKETISLNVAYQKLNREEDLIQNLASDNITDVQELYIGNDLYNYLINIHKDDELYKIIIDLLLQGYSKYRISKIINKTRPVVERRIEKLKKEIEVYYNE